MKPDRQLIQLDDQSNEQIKDFEKYLVQKRYSSNTIHSYVECLRIFVRFSGNKSVMEIEKQDIERFNNEYIIKHNLSESYQNQVVNALRLYFIKLQNVEIPSLILERPRREKKLPIVLNLAEVERILNVTTNLKHLSMLALIYSSGLRSGELINLKIKDIDSTRMIIHIHNAKGKKDRVVPLANTSLLILREYFQKYRPKEYLFNGDNKANYSRASLQAVFKKACRLAKINKQCTLHTLRHSYATHLLEEGINLRYIQEILGHNSSRTTEIYTHVTNDSARKVSSPIEKITLNRINNTER